MLSVITGNVHPCPRTPKLKIALIAPPYVAVPPKQYGGTELVVALLAQELVALGHDVHIFASGDSSAPGTLHPMCPVALYDAYPDDPVRQREIARDATRRALVQAQTMGFDIIHAHSPGVLGYKPSRIPMLTTLHNSDPDTHEMHRVFDDVPVVACSKAQRAAHDFNFIDAVHHSIDLSRYRFGTGSGGYLAFLGRTAPEKGIVMAIEVAKAAKRKLKIAAKILPDDYYETAVVPAIEASDGLAEFIGEIGGEAEKSAFLGNAAALLFPIAGEEAFGLVQIEAMACGTPVIAPRLSTVPEIVRENRSGAIVEHTAQAYAAAIDRVERLDRRSVRAFAEAYFSPRTMVERYVDVYRKVIAGDHAAPQSRMVQAA